MNKKILLSILVVTLAFTASIFVFNKYNQKNNITINEEKPINAFDFVNKPSPVQPAPAPTPKPTTPTHQSQLQNQALLRPPHL